MSRLQPPPPPMFGDQGQVSQVAAVGDQGGGGGGSGNGRGKGNGRGNGEGKGGKGGAKGNGRSNIKTKLKDEAWHSTMRTLPTGAQVCWSDEDRSVLRWTAPGL